MRGERWRDFFPGARVFPLDKPICMEIQGKPALARSFSFTSISNNCSDMHVPVYVARRLRIYVYIYLRGMHKRAGAARGFIALFLMHV